MAPGRETVRAAVWLAKVRASPLGEPGAQPRAEGRHEGVSGGGGVGHLGHRGAGDGLESLRPR